MFSLFSMFSIFSKPSPCSPIQDYRTPQFVEPFSYISHSWHNLSSISLFWDCLSGKFQSWGQNAGQRRAGHTTWPHTTSKRSTQLGELELEAASCGQASFTNHLKSWPSRGSGWKSLQLVCLCHNLLPLTCRRVLKYLCLPDPDPRSSLRMRTNVDDVWTSGPCRTLLLILCSAKIALVQANGGAILPSLNKVNWWYLNILRDC